MPPDQAAAAPATRLDSSTFPALHRARRSPRTQPRVAAVLPPPTGRQPADPTTTARGHSGWLTVVNLLPAHVPKHGSGFDLAVAVSLLAGAGVLPVTALDMVVLVGELGLDGTVRPVRGVL